MPALRRWLEEPGPDERACVGPACYPEERVGIEYCVEYQRVVRAGQGGAAVEFPGPFYSR